MRDSRGGGEAIASRSLRWTGLLAGDPQLAAYDGDELFDSLRTAKEMEVGVRRIPGNRVPETRHALATIGQNPAPEVGALRRSAQGAPGAAEECEVQYGPSKQPTSGRGYGLDTRYPLIIAAFALQLNRPRVGSTVTRIQNWLQKTSGLTLKSAGKS
jgi:hypothetical protein